MEVIKSRYGLDRSIEKIDYVTMRVMGESSFTRVSTKKGEVMVFDFEGGPYLNVGGKIFFGKINWKINHIDNNVPTYKGLDGCHITVEPIY
jgi:hypothetical protein